MRCPACGTENEAGRKFCGECGSPLAQLCPACGAANGPAVKFCGECGTPLAEHVPSPAQPTAERRRVSVLFADLVGFTAASEGRDAEETRELLSRYFEAARTLIERYGGTVEKFIGDAVMAVWGAPTATEDDAERAVRAALDLVAVVSELDPALQARAGVLTGEAAVTVGAEGQGMVAGDLVNTASRIQSAAEPGAVLVGEATRRATEAAVVYADAGAHELKGKAEAVALWRAVRVVAGAGGAMRSTGLEAPFVGRARELRLVKELYHAAVEERKAQLVAVVGVAGIGKSRLSWEFEKYVDGLADDAYWHRGRCLSYGDGVAYWALAEMVRGRCGIVEDEDPGSARAKLDAALETYLPDAEERGRVEPRLAHLLGLEEGQPGDQENLFSAWRILFERLAEQSPVVLVFEDMQWADAGLLDFLEYLLDWARTQQIFVLALARPELADRRPSWGAGKRSFTSLYLEPLSTPAMNELLSGLVPGLPEDLRSRILERAEGIPLYAVETVRMLFDRGLVTREGEQVRVSGPVETLEVPETLHALIAARLDSLPAEERRLVQNGSVLGKTFTRQGLAALTASSENELEPLLAGLVRKEVLAIQADPRSPERGQYVFLQDVFRRVAYETLSRTERKARHLAAADVLDAVYRAGEDELAEVVAAHLLDAYEAAAEASDAGAIKERARATLSRAAERAASLGATLEAQRAFERAAELSDEPEATAELLERAGTMALVGARTEQALELFERAIGIFESVQATHPAARVSAVLAGAMWRVGRTEEALDLMKRSYAVLSVEEPDEALAELAAELGRISFFAGDPELALELTERALDLAEALLLPELLSQALNTKGIVLCARGRRSEGLALVTHALEVAREHDRPSAILRGYFNLADQYGQIDRHDRGAEMVREGLAYARRIGNRQQEWNFLGQGYSPFALGEWDEWVAMIRQIPEESLLFDARQALQTVAIAGVAIEVHRGRVDEAERLLGLCREMEGSDDVQEHASYRYGEALVLRASGRTAEALAAVEEAFAVREFLGMSGEVVKEAFVLSVEAALELDEVDKAEQLVGVLERLPGGRVPDFLAAHAARFRAALAAPRGENDEAERRFKAAIGRFREIAARFWVAVAELEYAEWLRTQGRIDDAEALLPEAREIFEALGATPWLDRAAAASEEAMAGGVS